MAQNEQVRIPWPDWRIVRRLGSGGFGSVYEIERDVLGMTERAALKLVQIPLDPADVEADYLEGYDRENVIRKYGWYLERTVKEYQMMAELKGHSNIVNCNDIEVVPHDDGIGWTVYIRMELLTPLKKVEKGGMSEQQVVKLGLDICRALILCEERNIIHRDIKPSNILMTEFGDFKLGDFGIARTLEHSTHASCAGTANYMAPEVEHREKYGKNVDIYSLGLVLYYLLNHGRLPFLPLTGVPGAQENQQARKRRLSGEALPEPAEGTPELKRIVLKACAYRREDRYQSAGEMEKDLKNLRNFQRRGGQHKNEGKHARTTVKYPPLGIYFGDEEICASVYQERSNHFTMVTIPTGYTVTALGEVLTGERMKMYMRCHKNVKRFVFPVLQAIEERGGFRGTGMEWKNYIVPVQEIVHALLGELRRKLAEMDAVWGDARECVLACSTVSETCRDAMRELFAECGFDVKRVLNSAVACAAAEMTEGQRGICCAVERKRISVSQMVVEEGLWEVIHSEVYPFAPQPVSGDQEAVEQKILLFLSGKEAYDELAKMKLRLFLSPLARRAIGGQFQYPDLAAAAATGAAKQCAKVFGCGIAENFLLLDVIETDLGVEFLNADGVVTLGLKWLIYRQTSIPTRKFYNKNEKGNAPVCWELPAGTRTLRLCMNRYGLKNYETRTFSLADAYGGVSRIPEKLEVSVDIDVPRMISIGLWDPADKKKKEFYLRPSRELFLFPSYKKVADAWRRFRETGQRQTAAAAISVTARIHRKTSEYCREFEKIWKTCPGGKTTFRQGLQKIEKQCRTLMRDTGGAESGKSHTQVLEQFLQVSDSLEFAVRQVPADTDGNLEKHLVRLWEDCGKFLREELDVRHIPAEGLPFNPNLHYALMKESRPDIGDEIVLEELQRGYFYQNRVFRPTKVKVASKG